MSYATLYLNDASITLFQDGKILYCQPSCVWIRNNEIEIGASALSKSRIMPQYIDTHYWSNLSTLKYSSDHNKHISSAEIVSRELEIIKSERKASTSFLQRKLQIGYNRAARIMETMEEEGIVGQANHGVCAVGLNPWDAYEHIERLEHICEIALRSGRKPPGSET